MVDVRRLVGEDAISGEDDEDTRLLRASAAEARRYVESLGYWRTIRRVRFGWGVGGIIAVFLVEAEPTSPDVDECVWVVVGDVPPLYIVTDDAPDPWTATEAYLELRQEWVEAVRAGDSVEGLAPVNVPATTEWADRLASRLESLRDILEQRRPGP